MVQPVEVVRRARARQDGEASISGMDGQLLEQPGLAGCGFACHEQQVTLSFRHRVEDRAYSCYLRVAADEIGLGERAQEAATELGSGRVGGIGAGERRTVESSSIGVPEVKGIDQPADGEGSGRGVRASLEIADDANAELSPLCQLLLGKRCLGPVSTEE